MEFEDIAVIHGLREQEAFPLMRDVQFEFTADLVKAVLYPWLKLHFGERCDDYEYGCECCIRWAMADRLLARDRNGTPEKIEEEIKTLQTCLRWRQDMLASMNKEQERRNNG